MTKTEFVQFLRDHAAPGLHAAACRALEAPPGRDVSPERRARAAWCNGLPPQERAHLEAALRDAVDLSLFSILCILDGVEDSPASLNGGKITLLHVAEDGTEQVLADPDEGEYLHEIFNTR